MVPLHGSPRCGELRPRPKGAAGVGSWVCNSTADKCVVESVMEGVDQLFERMVHEHKDRIFAASLAMTGNRHDAEEVAQDTFLRAYRALCTYSPERIQDLKERAWLHRLAVNVVRNRVRRVHPRLLDLNGTDYDHEPGPEAKVMERMQIDELATRV